MPGELPEVTLEPGERARLAYFFQRQRDNILAYNALAAEVEAMKTKELQRRDALKRMKQKTDIAFDQAMQGKTETFGEEGELLEYQEPVHIPGRKRYPRVR